MIGFWRPAAISSVASPDATTRASTWTVEPPAR
jgi:hypothetical protein